MVKREKIYVIKLSSSVECLEYLYNMQGIFKINE